VSEDIKIECRVCGYEGQPPVGCSTCKGTAPTQSRAFTLSDVRAGRVKEDPRYGLEGKVGPATSDPLWAGTDTNH
jgi:hypothetical protein